MSLNLNLSPADQVRIWRALDELHRAGTELTTADLERYVVVAPDDEEALVARIHAVLQANPVHKIPDQIGAPGMGSVLTAQPVGNRTRDEAWLRRELARFTAEVAAFKPYQPEHVANWVAGPRSDRTSRTYTLGGKKVFFAWNPVSPTPGVLDGLIVYRWDFESRHLSVSIQPVSINILTILNDNAERDTERQRLLSGFDYLPVETLQNDLPAFIHHPLLGLIAVVEGKKGGPSLGLVANSPAYKEFFKNKLSAKPSQAPHLLAPDAALIRRVQTELTDLGQPAFNYDSLCRWLDSMKVGEGFPLWEDRVGGKRHRHVVFVFDTPDGPVHAVLRKVEGEPVIHIAYIKVSQAPDLAAFINGDRSAERDRRLFEALEYFPIRRAGAYAHFFIPDSGSYFLTGHPQRPKHAASFNMFPVSADPQRAITEVMAARFFTLLSGNGEVYPALSPEKLLADAREFLVQTPDARSRRPFDPNQTASWFAGSPDADSPFVDILLGNDRIRHYSREIYVSHSDRPVGMVCFRWDETAKELSVALLPSTDQRLRNYLNAGDAVDAQGHLLQSLDFYNLTVLPELHGHAFTRHPQAGLVFVAQGTDGFPCIGFNEFDPQFLRHFVSSPALLDGLRGALTGPDLKNGLTRFLNQLPLGHQQAFADGFRDKEKLRRQALPIDFKAVNPEGYLELFTPEGFDAIPKKHPLSCVINGERMFWLAGLSPNLGGGLLVKRNGAVEIIPAGVSPGDVLRVHRILASPKKEGRINFTVGGLGLRLSPYRTEGILTKSRDGEESRHVFLEGDRIRVLAKGRGYSRTDVYIFDETILGAVRQTEIFKPWAQLKDRDDSCIYVEQFTGDPVRYLLVKTRMPGPAGYYLLNMERPELVMALIPSNDETFISRLREIKPNAQGRRVIGPHDPLFDQMSVLFLRATPVPGTYQGGYDGDKRVRLEVSADTLQLLGASPLESTYPLKPCGVIPLDPAEGLMSARNVASLLNKSPQGTFEIYCDDERLGQYLCFTGNPHYLIFVSLNAQGEVVARLRSLDDDNAEEKVAGDFLLSGEDTVLTQNGIPLKGLVPLPGRPGHFLQMEEDELFLVSEEEPVAGDDGTRLSKQQFWALEVHSKPRFAYHIRTPDPLEPVWQALKHFNQSKKSPEKMNWQISGSTASGAKKVVEFSAPGAEVPVFGFFYADDGRQFTYKDLSRGTFRANGVKFSIKWGSRSSEPVIYDVRSEGGHLVLRPSGTTALGGEIRLAYQSGGTTVCLVPADAELSSFLHRARFGPDLLIQLDGAQLDGKNRCVIRGDADQDKTLLAQVYQALSPDLEKPLEEISVDKEGRWQLAILFKTDEISNLTRLIATLEGILTQSQNRERHIVWREPTEDANTEDSKKNEPQIVVQMLAAQPDHPRHETFSITTVVGPVQSVTAQVDHEIGEEGEHYLVNDLSPAAGRILESTCDGKPVVWPILLEDGKKPVLELLVETKEGWQKIQVGLELAAGPVVAILGFENLTRASLTRATVIAADPFTLKLLLLTNPHTGAEELTGAVAVLGEEEIAIPGRYPQPFQNQFTLGVPDPFAGRIDFGLSRNGDRSWRVLRSPAEFLWELDVQVKPPVLRALSLGEKSFEVAMAVTPVATAQGKAVRYFIPSSETEKLKPWLARMGHPPFEGSQEVVVAGREVSLMPITRNRDNSWPVREIVLSDFESRTLSDYLAGQVSSGKNILFGAADWPLTPQAVLLPSRKHLDYLISLYKPNAKRRDENFLPFAPGSVLTDLLDYETEGGFGLGLPVSWASRRFPFKLDAEGSFMLGAHGELLVDDEGKIWLDGGRRPLTYLRGQEEHRRMADTSLAAFDDGGNWRLSIVTQAGLHLLFAVVRHPLCPILTALVDISDVNHDPAARDKRERAAQKALDDHLLAYFANAVIPPPVEDLSSIEATNTESGTRLTYSSAVRSNGVRLELSGVTFDSGRILFDETLILKRTLNMQSQTLMLEHQLTDEPDVIRVKEILAGGGLGRVYEWNIRLGTLVQLSREIPNIPSWYQVQEFLTDKTNLPLSLPAAKKFTPLVRFSATPVASWKPLSVRSPLMPPLPDNDRSFVMPPQARIEKMTEGKAITELLKKVSLHDQVFLPTKDTAFAQARVGGMDEVMTFVSSSGIVLQLPMERYSRNPREWELGTVGEQGWYWSEARLLVPDPDQGGFYRELAVNWGEKRSLNGTLQLKDHPKINLNLAAQSCQTAEGCGAVFGYHLTEKGGVRNVTRTPADLQTEIRAAADYYKLTQSGDEASIPWPDNGSIKDILLANGEILDLTFSKSGGEILLEGLKEVKIDGTRRMVVDSTEGLYEIYPSPDFQRLYCLKSPQGVIFDLALDDTGVQLWRQRDHIREFLFPPSSVGFKMVGIDGEVYHSKKSSVATRKHLSQPQDEIQKYAITAVLGRWEGASSTALTVDAQGEADLARLRVVVSVDAQGKLSVTPGELSAEEKKKAGHWLWGDDFEARIVEDEWMGPHGPVRGKVRLIFSKPDAFDAAGKACMPYGTLEFDSRENLIGAYSRFTVARAHHHKFTGLRERKLFPLETGFLTHRAGVASSTLQIQENQFTGDEGETLLENLSATRGCVDDIPVLVEALTYLKLHDATLDLFDDLGRPREEALVAMAAFGMKRNAQLPQEATASPARRRTPPGGRPVAQIVPGAMPGVGVPISAPDKIAGSGTPKIQARQALAPVRKAQFYPSIARVTTVKNPAGIKAFTSGTILHRTSNPLARGIWGSRHFLK